jgi:hypothetical protein
VDLPAANPRLIEKLIGIAIQYDGLSGQQSGDQLAILMQKRSAFLKLKDNLEWIRGEEELLNYLETAFTKGEVFALQRLESTVEP